VNSRLLIVLPWLFAFPAYAATSLPIDASHTAVVFTWNHRGLSHPVARLEQISGSVSLDTTDITRSAVSITLPLAGLRTGDDHLDQRLRGPEFFAAEKYPQITFRSTRVEKSGTDVLTVTGDLRVRDVIKSVALTVKINKIIAAANKPPEAGFDADVLLRRSDFELGKYVPMVSDEVGVHITLEAHAD
jgi:polyisoprenoid-binding protein YceI